MLTEMEEICPDCFSFRYQESGCPDCGYRVPALEKGGPALPVRTLLLNGRYMIGKVLGIGGCGITYKAFDMLYREVCTVKEFVPQGLAGRVPGGQDLQVYNIADRVAYQHSMERFIEEARMLKRLEKEPAVVQVKECFTEHQTAYFVMEFLDGQDLRQAVRRRVVTTREALRIIIEIGTVMGVVHSQKILHRDISPENIFLLKDGRVKILDFGSARQQLRKGRQEYSVQFKQGFAPPEQYSRTGVQGTYTDVYALASTCYYVLTGHMVPDAVDRLQNKSYMSLARLCPEAGQAVSDAVDRALELDYRKRTQTMEEFVAGLRGSGQAQSAGPTGIGQDDAGIAQRIPQGISGDVLGVSQSASGPAMGHRGDGGKAAGSEGCICGVSGIHKGKKFPMKAGGCVVIGRDGSRCDLVLMDQKVSRVHCELRYDRQERRYILYDCSTNGTFLENGAQIGQRRAVALPPGTRIRIGTSEDVFLLQ